jgi:two-component system competent response regulator ComA
MDHKIKVLIIEDHPTMGYGTKMVLEQDENVNVVGIAENGAKGIEMINTLCPSIVFLDLNLPDNNGLEIAKMIRKLNPKIHVVIFTGYDFLPFFNRLIEAGVSGIISKNALPRQVIRMLQCIIDGETVLPLSIFRQIQLHSNENDENQWNGALSEKEKNIVLMVAKGHTNAQIANEIYMSVRSVENYLTKIYEKLGVKSRVEAVEKFTKENSTSI